MAGARTDPGYPRGTWLAALLGLAALGGTLVCGQVPREPAAAAEGSEQVVQVRVVGNVGVPRDKILRHIRTRAGRPYDPERIEEDVRRLYGSGLFVNVKPHTQRVDGGRVVIFEVYERPILHYVKYVGNQKIKKKTLQKEADIKAGDAMDTFAVEEGRRRLVEFYRSHGFSNARVTIVEGDRPSDRGVIYLINEGQKQRILWTQFVGNTIASDARLRTQIRSKPGFLWIFKGEVDRRQIEEDLDRLTAYYRGLGFFAARVGRELHFNEDQNWLTLTFVIDEGPRYVVRNVSFIGNTQFSSEELAAELKLKEGEFFNQADMQHDQVTITDKYGSKGYVFAEIKPDPRFLEEPGQLDLVYNIREGRPCRVGRIVPKITGDYPHTQITTILNRMSLKPNDIVDTRKLRASERRLQASGLFEVDPTRGIRPKIVFSPPDLEEMEIRKAERPGRPRGQSPDPEPTSRPGAGPSRPGRSPPPSAKPIIRGQYSPDAGRTVPPFPAVGSQLPPRPQLPPPDSSQPPLPPSPNEQAGYVEAPIVDGFPSLLGNPPSEDPALDITLEPMVQETRTGRFMFSVGVNSEAGLLGSIIIDEQNFDLMRFPRSWQEIRDGIAFRGAGQRLRIEAVPGTEVQRYTVNFQEPYLLNTRISLGLSGYFYNRRFREWDEERLGGRLALGYQFTPDLSGVFAYRGAKINIHDPIVPFGGGLDDLDEVVGDNALHGFQVRLAHDTRDNAFLATQGHLIELTFEQVVGSFDYPRGEIDIRKYFMLHQRPDGSGRHVLSLNGRMAVTGSNTPIYEHFYAGGFSTIRGFDFRGASPRDPLFGVVVGGEFMLLASAEYLFPITADDTIRAVVFCDTGTVEPSINEWTDKYRVSPGFGLRITIPAMGPAPIALDLAFPASLEGGDEVENFSFFVGFLR